MNRDTGWTDHPFLNRAISRKRFLGLGAGAAAGALLSACGGGPQNNPAVQGQDGKGGGGKTYDGPEVELEFWNGLTGGDGPYMRRMLKQFTAEHPKIKVKMSAFPWVEYYQKLATAVQSGRAPDVGIIHLEQLPTNAARQVVTPLDDVAEVLELKEADFVPTVWKAGEYQGKRYGIPLDVFPVGFFYNKTTMEKAGLDPEKPPKTREEYESALDTFKGKGIRGHWVFPGAWPSFPVLLWQFGGDLYNADATEAMFHSSAGVEALTWVRDLIKDGYSPKSVGEGADVVGFQNGKNPFLWHGPWNINEFKKDEKLDWGVTQMPTIGAEQVTHGGSHNLVLPRQRTPDDNKLQAAKVFVNWLSTNSVEWAKAGQVPARNTAREDPEFGKLEEQSAFAEQLSYVRFYPPVPGLQDIWDQIIDPAVNKVLLLKEEPQEALEKTAERVNKLLAENREKYGTS